jgi:pyruvate dehydrogenase E1 component alpha subunit
MHLIDKRVGMAGTSAIVGGAVPIAVGAALAAHMKGDSRVVVVFLGDATTEEGVASESLNFAALKQVPVIFFCENNFYSVQSPLWTRQPAGRDIRRWAEAHEVPAVTVDGANVLEVLDATSSAVDRARAGGGPSFIEARVYRFRAHGGAGDDSKTGYRDEAERVAWEPFDPIRMFGDYLLEAAVIHSHAIGDMEEAIRREVAEAFEFALASPNPTEEQLYQHVYAE